MKLRLFLGELPMLRKIRSFNQVEQLAVLLKTIIPRFIRMIYYNHQL